MKCVGKLDRVSAPCPSEEGDGNLERIGDGIAKQSRNAGLYAFLEKRRKAGESS